MSTYPRPAEGQSDSVRLLKVGHATVYLPTQIRPKGRWLERLARVSALAQGTLLIEQIP